MDLSGMYSFQAFKDEKKEAAERIEKSTTSGLEILEFYTEWAETYGKIEYLYGDTEYNRVGEVWNIFRGIIIWSISYTLSQTRHMQYCLMIDRIISSYFLWFIHIVHCTFLHQVF